MSDNPEVRIDATLATENIPAQTARLISEISRLADTINTHGARASQGLADVNKHADGLAGAFQHVGTQFEQAFSSRAILGEMASGFLAIAGPVALVTVGLEGIRDIIGEIRDFSREGIIKADELRDLGLSLNIIERGAGAGADAFARMESAAEKTRNVGDELIATYRRLEPLASARGFSHEELQNVTTMLSQLSTIRGVDFETMAGGFQQLLAGRVMPGRNPLLAALGITKADVENLGWDQIIAKMRQVSAHFPEFGQSFESELNKIKEDLLVTFAEGFAGARGSAMSGMESLREVLHDPAIRGDIQDLGSLVAGVVSHIGDVAIAIEGVVTAVKKLPSLPPWLIPFGPVLLPGMAIDAAGALKAKQEQRAMEASAAEGWQGRYFMHGLGFDDSYQTPGFKDQQDLYKRVSESLSGMSIKGQGELVRGLTAAMKDHILTAREYGVAEEKAFEVDAPKGKVKIDDLAGTFDKLRGVINKTTAELALLALQQEAAGRTAITRYDSYAAELGYEEQLAKNRQKEITDLEALREAARKGGGSAALGELISSENAARSGGEFAAFDAVDDAAASRSLSALQAINPLLGEAATKLHSAREESDRLAQSILLIASSSAVQAWVSKLDLTPAGWTHSGGTVWDAGDNIVQTDPSLELPSRGASMNALISRLLQSGGLTPASDADLRQWLTVGKAVGDGARKQLLDEQFITTFGDDIGTVFQNGGRDFLHAVGGGLSDLLRQSGVELAGYLFGSKGNASLPAFDSSGAYLGMQIPTRRYDSQGKDITGLATTGRAIYGGAAIGIGSYDAVLSGASRTSTTLQGGLAGAGLGAELAAGTSFAAAGASGAVAGGIVGAIAGLLIAGVAAAIATQEKQAQYKFGIPSIDSSGHAQFQFAQNYTDADIIAMTRRIQVAYDAIHDSIARTLMKIDGVLLPAMMRIDGGFQPNPSSHFAQHFETWVNSTLGDEVWNQFKPEFDVVREQLKFGVTAWNEIMGQLNLVDPTKRAQLFDQLVTAKQDINKAIEFLVGNTSYTSLQGRSGSAAYETTFADLSLHRPFSSSQREVDDEIIRFASNIKNLSFEGQIAAETELAQKMTARGQAVQQAIEGIFQAFEDGTKRYRDAFEQADVIGYTRADGTVDQAGLALFYKQRAQQALERERFASTPQLASQFDQDFIRYIQQAGAASLAGGALPTDVAKWERDQLAIGQGVFNAALTRMGTDIDKLNDTFLTKLNPQLETLYGKTGDLTTIIGVVGDRFGKIIDPLDRVGAGADSVAGSLSALVIAIDAATARFNASSSANFVNQTVAMRASR